MSQGHDTGAKKATMNGLAAVGFIALLLFGVFLAIYAASYVPETLSRLSGAVFLSNEEPSNTDEEVPAPVEEEEEPRTPSVPSTPTTPTTPTTPSTPSTGGPLYVPQTPVVTYTQPRLYGLPDLAIVDVRTGYMRGSTFVEDDEVPSNRDAAVRFIVQNLGTNVVSDWRLRVDVTGEDTATGIGGVLYPIGTQVFTLRIENPEEGERLRINIEVDPQDRINEEDEDNNEETVRIDIED